MLKLSRYIPLAVGSSALLLLGGCANAAEDALNITKEVDTHTSELVTELNALIEAESDLQSAFETTLAEDEELATLSDGTSEVFTNIEMRRESLPIIEEKVAALTEQHTALTEGNYEDLPQEEVTALIESLDQTTGTVTDFTSQYAEALDTQTQFFEALGAEDASYETMTEGIDTIAEEDEQTKQSLGTVDDQLSTLKAANDTLNQSLTEQLESNE